MGKVLLIVLQSYGVFCLIGLSGCDTYPGTKASALVTANYPGKSQPEQCRPYADALYKALKIHHIPAWKVCYLGGLTPNAYLHVMVVYKDAGSYWYADNDFPYPTKSWGTIPAEWVCDRSDLDTNVCDGTGMAYDQLVYCKVMKVDSDVQHYSVAQRTLRPHMGRRRQIAYTRQ